MNFFFFFNVQVAMLQQKGGASTRFYMKVYDRMFIKIIQYKHISALFLNELSN